MGSKRETRICDDSWRSVLEMHRFRFLGNTKQANPVDAPGSVKDLR